MVMTPEMMPTDPLAMPEFQPGNPGGLEQDPLAAPQQLLGDMYPYEDKAHDELLGWALNAITEAESAVSTRHERWKRYNRLYHGAPIKRRKGDWHSKVVIPVVFWVIETIVPRLVAQLPNAVVLPVGPEDEFAAKKMESLLQWAIDKSELYVALIRAIKSALKYGTGILKTSLRTDVSYVRRAKEQFAEIPQIVTTPVVDEFGNQMFDMNGEPMIERSVAESAFVSAGTQMVQEEYISYDGPQAENIDIFDILPAPEAIDVQSARYIIHRSVKEFSHVKQKIAEGVYKLPAHLREDEIVMSAGDNYEIPHVTRDQEVGNGGGGADLTRRSVELHEIWTDDNRLITILNRRAVIRCQRNPYDHNEKPFVRIVDYLDEGFWGIGEVQHIESLQDLINAITNQRIDNLRLILNAMFAVNEQDIVDAKDLTTRPGGLVRTRGDKMAKDAVHRIDFGDVTQTAYQETQSAFDTTEKITGVSSYSMGLDSPTINNTATGAAIISEQGASRFGLKSKVTEVVGLTPLMKQFGSILQQFTDQERMVRMYGPEGQYLWEQFTPDSIQGAFDYTIQSESMTQTKTVRQEQKMNLLTTMAQFWPQGVQAALEDVVEEMGVKDKSRYLMGQQPMMQPPSPAAPGVPAGAPMMPGGMPGLPAPAPSGLPPEVTAAMMQPPSYPGMGPPVQTDGAMAADRMMAAIAELHGGRS